MAGGNLTKFFESFIAKDSVFKNRKVLQSVYTPETIIHRDDEVKQLAQILAPCLRLEKPSNIFIYGKTGTGKTLTVRYTTRQILEVSQQRELPINIIYLNCKMKKVADTEYRLIAQLAREFGKTIPATGLPTDEVYRIFFDVIDSKKQIIILVLDEIDQLVAKTGDELLYNLTRVNDELKKAQISLLGISNDITFSDTLDPRIKSSLSEEEINFAPYNAIQIQEILRIRSKEAFKDGSLEDGVIEKCAAYAAREHGDARRALELLRVSGELAERNNEKKVCVRHLDMAEEKIERDRVFDTISVQPKQHQLTLYSLLLLTNDKKDGHFTGEVYEIYKDLCKQTGLRPLTQRRVSDVLSEMDMLGIINAKVISKGRYGRTKEMSLGIPASTRQKIMSLLKENLGL